MTSVAPATAASGSRVERLVQRHRRAGLELGVLVEQQDVAPARAPQQRRVVLPLAAALLGAITSVVGSVGARGRPEPSREALSSTITSVSNGTAARSRAIESRQRRS